MNDLPRCYDMGDKYACWTSPPLLGAIEVTIGNQEVVVDAALI